MHRTISDYPWTETGQVVASNRGLDFSLCNTNTKGERQKKQTLCIFRLLAAHTQNRTRDLRIAW